MRPIRRLRAARPRRPADIIRARRRSLAIRLGVAAGLVVPLVTGSALRAGRPTRSEGPVAVRYAEGALHGFLRLRDAAGTAIADGDLLQVPRRAGLDSRMVFHFRDGSLFDERVVFTQRGVFRMERYSLVQRGPAFREDLEVTLAASGAWSVKTRSRADGEAKAWSGTLSLPADTYNGMPIVIAKNLQRPDTHRVHIVAFTPRPRLVGLEFAPDAHPAVPIGDRRAKAVRYVLKPKLSTFLEVFARVLGKFPPDSHAWIVTEGVPAFVGFEGPMYSGPVWRVELAAPGRP